MTAFKERPYRLLLWAALLVFALGLLDANTSPYIRLQSLYFPVSSALLYRLLSLGLASAWLLYRLTERFLFSRYLTGIRHGDPWEFARAILGVAVPERSALGRGPQTLP